MILGLIGGSLFKSTDGLSQFIVYHDRAIRYSCQNNVIPNHGFEDYLDCDPTPTFNGNVQYWSSANYGSVDYFNACDTTFDGKGVPFNKLGYQQADDGNAYCGFVTMTKIINFREYPQARLNSPLVANQTYCLSFFVSLSDSSVFATNNIGVYFSADSIEPIDSKVLNYTPQINITDIISDTSNWVEVSGQYTATGGEQFLIIGNFYPDNQTDTMRTGVTLTTFNGQEFAHYYLDNVSLCLCSDTVSTVSNSAVTFQKQQRVYPNPVSNELTIEFGQLLQSGIARFYDVTGREVLVVLLANQDRIVADVTELKSGIYYCKITSDQGSAVQQISVVR